MVENQRNLFPSRFPYPNNAIFQPSKMKLVLVLFGVQHQKHALKFGRVVQGIHGPIGLRQNQNLFLRVEPRVVVIHFGFHLASSKMIGRCSIEGILELYQKHLEGRRRQRDLTSRQHGRGRRQ